MDRLSTEPATLSELVEADLRRAARLIVRIQDEIDWQLRIATRQGDYHVAVTMPASAHARLAMLQRLGLFMAWKAAYGFTLATELYEPDSVWCAGVSGSASWKGFNVLLQAMPIGHDGQAKLVIREYHPKEGEKANGDTPEKA